MRINYHHITKFETLTEKLDNILKERGIEFNCPPTLSVNQNLKVTFCRDFEGNFLELTEEIP